jgi:hypothetical protein
VVALSDALKTNTALRRLDFRDLGLCDAELRALLPGLKANRGLRWLDLGSNQFNEKAARELLAVFKEHPTLVGVFVDDCGLSKKFEDEFDALSYPRNTAAVAAGTRG